MIDVKYCNWEFEYFDKNKWLVKRDCENKQFTLTRCGGKNWDAYRASLQPTRQGQPRNAPCPVCSNTVNAVNPGDDGETWRK